MIPNLLLIVLHGGTTAKFFQERKKETKESDKKDLLNIKTDMRNMNLNSQTGILNSDFTMLNSQLVQSYQISTDLLPPVMHAAQLPVGCCLFCS